MNRLLSVLSPALLFVLLCGCFYSVQQTPEPIPPGDVVLGPCVCAGHGYVIPDKRDSMTTYGTSPAAELGVQTRLGITSGLDGGLRLSFPLGVLADLKYLLLRRPFLVAADLGFSVTPRLPTGLLSDNPGEYNECYIGYLTLLAGTGRFYGGPRFIYGLNYEHGGSPPERFLLSGVVLGGSFGRRFRLLPEADVFLRRSSVGWTVLAAFGIGAQFQLRRHAR
jgi:hypothetical protein